MARLRVVALLFGYAAALVLAFIILFTATAMVMREISKAEIYQKALGDPLLAKNRHSTLS